jgi:hypothetical protein
MDISMSADNNLKARLLPGERIVWQGRPAQGIRFFRSDTFLIPFGILFLSFSIFWEWKAVSQGDVFFALWGIPFIAAGIFLCAARFLIDAYVRSSTLYALTDNRILILRRGYRPRFVALTMDRLPVLSLEEERSGTGTIRFQPPISLPAQRNEFAQWLPSLDDWAFVKISDARNVFERMQRASAGR